MPGPRNFIEQPEFTDSIDGGAKLHAPGTKLAAVCPMYEVFKSIRWLRNHKCDWPAYFFSRT